mmetsp:Transcript_11091/g.31888  ORF Transcript_11091/g.31888 Transcript_11091/m.31888 type:complete len:275 (-) Transcript_11091:505-1329(-)
MPAIFAAAALTLSHIKIQLDWTRSSQQRSHAETYSQMVNTERNSSVRTRRPFSQRCRSRKRQIGCYQHMVAGLAVIEIRKRTIRLLLAARELQHPVHLPLVAAEYVIQSVDEGLIITRLSVVGERRFLAQRFCVGAPHGLDGRLPLHVPFGDRVHGRPVLDTRGLVQPSSCQQLVHGVDRLDVEVACKDVWVGSRQHLDVLCGHFGVDRHHLRSVERARHVVRPQAERAPRRPVLQRRRHQDVVPVLGHLPRLHRLPLGQPGRRRRGRKWQRQW